MKEILTALAIIAILYLHMISQTDETKDVLMHGITDNLIP